MRTMTLKEFLLEEINKDLREEGRDIQIVLVRPRPRLVVGSGEVVPMLSTNRTGEMKEEVQT